MITFDPLSTEFMLQRASRIEARLRRALTEKCGIDLSELREGLGLKGYQELLASNGITIEHITPVHVQFDRRIETYRVFKYEEVVDQFEVDFFGIINEITGNETETSHRSE